MSHGAAACASKLTHMGSPLPTVATDSATAKQKPRIAMGREKGITVLGKDNTPDCALFLTEKSPDHWTPFNPRRLHR